MVLLRKMIDTLSIPFSLAASTATECTVQDASPASQPISLSHGQQPFTFNILYQEEDDTVVLKHPSLFTMPPTPPGRLSSTPPRLSPWTTALLSSSPDLMLLVDV